MTGVWSPVFSSRSRIALSASNPSISGICRSIKTTSNRPCLQGGKRLGAVGRDDHAVTKMLEHANGHFLIHGMILGKQYSERCTRGRGAIALGETPVCDGYSDLLQSVISFISASNSSD